MKYLHKRAITKSLSGRFDHLSCYRRAVVIPALAEAEFLPLTLQSLYASEPHGILADTLILVVVNNRSPENSKVEELSELKDCIQNNALTLRWMENHTPEIPSHLAWIDASSPGNELPPWGGVGLARKIGCDSVLAFLADTSTPDLRKFIFFSLDADTLVSPDYLETAAAELRKSNCAGGTVPFKHQRADSPEGQAAIDAYEAFLHYYVAGLRWAGSPYAFHTIGSCICFTADGYMRANGFPARRQAGEDFYFCMELAKAGGICEIQKTMVFPSARISQRVPFGTGKRMADALLDGKKDFLVYDFRVFICLRDLLTTVSTHVDEGADRIFTCLNNSDTKDFLESREFPVIWERFQRQYKTRDAILAAFHRWFDGFVTLKYIHRLTEKKWPRVPLKDIPEANSIRCQNK
jgi:glycosyltransferase involved in cell wall biosynthesis